jgi:hypothetical protein
MKFYKTEWTTKYDDDGIGPGASVLEFYCRHCDKTNKLDKKGEEDIKQHIKSKMHERNKTGLNWANKYNDQVCQC